MRVEVSPAAFDHWIVVNADSPALAWSGSQWVRHSHGIPLGRWQVCSFVSYSSAVAYINRTPYLAARSTEPPPCPA
jgi:hypothetical protein